MKKKLLLLTFSCLAFSNPIFSNTDTSKYVIGCRGWGLFADFLWSINHLEYCLISNKTPVMHWGKSPYNEKGGYNGGNDAWSYYFEPVSNLTYSPGDVIHYERFPRGKENFTAIYDVYRDIVENPSYPSKELRQQTKEIMDRYVKLKPSVALIIESFYQKKMAGKHTIGIHLRGQHAFNEFKYPPLQEIFNEANKYATSKSQFFIATDQINLLNEAIKSLKGTVIYYDCFRTDKGSTAPTPSGFLFPINYSKARLGEDVLVETFLLSQCDVMIHTISNVPLVATYFNPELHGVRLYYENNSLKKYSY
jgi:hypothetical protein